MPLRGDYQVCNVCPRSKDCDYCSSSYRKDLNIEDGGGLVGMAIGVATGMLAGEIIEEVFDFFD